MLADHIGLFIPNTPIFLRWIGRLAAPIFTFCSVLAYSYTSNKKFYLLRLYIAGLVMSIIQCFIFIENNYFRTLFSICVLLSLLESYKNKDRNFKKLLIVYIIWQVFSISINILFLNALFISEEFGAYFLSALFGNIFCLEGGIIFTFLGVLFYLTKDNRKLLIIGYIVFCLFYFIATATNLISVVLGKFYHFGFTLLPDMLEYILDTIIGINPMDVGGSLIYKDFQWMMIAALPFLLIYNGKQGKKLKYIFYIFYPVHIIILFYIGSLIGK